MATATDTPLTFEDYTVTGPGIYDIPEDVYHADPVPGGSLSSSGARRLLPPSCPALFEYEQRHRRRPTEAMEFGTAAHLHILGTGPKVAPIDAANYQTKAAQQARDEARERGEVPMLPRELEQLEAMAESIRRHPVASVLLTRDWGRSEQSAFWRDRATGVICRARFDVWPHARTGRMIIPDLKTCRSAHPDAISKAVYEHGYHQQDPWYRAGAKALGLAGEDVAFLFVFLEKTPPYLVTVVELDAAAVAIGEARNRRALELYARCRKSGRWPGYSDDIETVTLPAWAERQGWEEEL